MDLFGGWGSTDIPRLIVETFLFFVVRSFKKDLQSLKDEVHELRVTLNKVVTRVNKLEKKPSKKRQL